MRVLGIAVVSVDGCLTRHGESGVSFSSPEDQSHFLKTMRECGATVMGRRTFDAVRDRILGSGSVQLLRTVVTRHPDRYAELARPGMLEFTAHRPADIIDALGTRGYTSVAVLGGAQLFDAFVAERQITEWHLTVEPRLFGEGIRLLGRATDQRLELTEHRLLASDTLFLRYRVR
jgi:dihydrofolate reductase